MYDAEHKIGIEYCGIYWHCEKFNKDKKRHISKMREAEKAGIRLITLYENEWLDRKAQVISYLTAAFGKNKIRLQARKCTVAQISKAEGQAFIEEHHIQGKNALGTTYAGLFAGDELLGVMSFGRHHRGGDATVLDRLCFKPDTSVIGGASKLFKFLINLTQAHRVISWSDNRWSQGGVYKQLGFKDAQHLPEDYAYVDTKHTRMISKQSQKKNNTKCPAGYTEKRWCQERGLYRIWDCGKIRWEYNA